MILEYIKKTKPSDYSYRDDYYDYPVSLFADGHKIDIFREDEPIGYSQSDAIGKFEIPTDHEWNVIGQNLDMINESLIQVGAKPITGEYWSKDRQHNYGVFFTTNGFDSPCTLIDFPTKIKHIRKIRVT